MNEKEHQQFDVTEALYHGSKCGMIILCRVKSAEVKSKVSMSETLHASVDGSGFDS